MRRRARDPDACAGPCRSRYCGQSAVAALAGALVSPTLVVNAAAYTKVDLAETNVEEARRGNEIGPAVLAERLRAAGSRWSTSRPTTSSTAARQSLIVETDPVRPISAYGRSKAAGEEAVAARSSTTSSSAPPGSTASSGKIFSRPMLRLGGNPQRIADRCRPTRQLRLRHGRSQTLSCISRLACCAIEGLSGTYHFTAEGVTTWHGFASRVVEIAASITGRNPRVIPIATADYPTPAKRPANSRLDCRLFVRTFGFTPRHWTEGVDMTTRTLVSCHAGDEKPCRVRE